MSNQSSSEAWEGERVQRWLRQSARLERQFSSVQDILLTATGLVAGESVLDVGCGTGPTTYAAASAVGPEGYVCGLDVSAEMLAAAASVPIPEPQQAAPIEWVHADDVTWSPDHDRYDAVISRFGVMFFTDPKAAFSHLATAARPGGRLVMAVWQRRDCSELFSVSLRASLNVLRSRGVRTTSAGISLDDFDSTDDEGPFSLHDPDGVESLLSGAGWSSVSVQPHVLALPFAGGVRPAAAAEAALDFGPTRSLLDGQDPATVDAARAAIGAAFADYTGPDGTVVLSGAINVVTATRVD